MVVDIGYFVLLCLLGGVLAWIDLDRGIIPDWLNLAIAGLGLSKALLVGDAVAGLEAACEGAAIRHRVLAAADCIMHSENFRALDSATSNSWRLRNLGQRRGPSCTSDDCCADRAALRRSHATGGTSIERSVIPAIRTVSGDRAASRVGPPTPLVVLLSYQFAGPSPTAPGIGARLHRQQRHRWRGDLDDKPFHAGLR